MQLPFTAEQFFDLFAAYNQALWPVAVALWIASAVTTVRLLWPGSGPDPRWIAALLAAHWLSGVVYHVVFFTRINPAAWGFAALFLAEALLFIKAATGRRGLAFASRSAWTPLARGFLLYALAYPAINAVDHHSLVRIPTFGLPCPTTIFTAGMLMMLGPRVWQLAIVPVIWSVIGGSAAPVLGVHADYALPVAGLALALYTLRPGAAARATDTAPIRSRETRFAR